jgi:hypothetical protein
MIDNVILAYKRCMCVCPLLRLYHIFLSLLIVMYSHLYVCVVDIVSMVMVRSLTPPPPSHDQQSSWS